RHRAVFLAVVDVDGPAGLLDEVGEDALRDEEAWARHGKSLPTAAPVLQLPSRRAPGSPPPVGSGALADRRGRLGAIGLHRRPVAEPPRDDDLAPLAADPLGLREVGERLGDGLPRRADVVAEIDV